MSTHVYQKLYYYLDEYYPNWRDRYRGNYGMIISINNNQDDCSINYKTNIVNNIDNLPWSIYDIINNNSKLKEYINECNIDNIKTLYFSIWFVFKIEKDFGFDYLTESNSLMFNRIITLHNNQMNITL